MKMLRVGYVVLYGMVIGRCDIGMSRRWRSMTDSMKFQLQLLVVACCPEMLLC